MKPVLFLLMLALVSCQNSEKPTFHENTTRFSGQAMTMSYKIIIGKTLDTPQIAQTNDLIAATFKEVDAIYNKWNPQSELSHLNKLKAGETCPLSQSLETLLKQTDWIVQLSEGRFDPTIEPLQKLWKQKLELNTIPSPEELAAIAPAIGWHHIHFGDGIFYKDHALTQLDLGGIAKGFAIDLLVERLIAQGHHDLYVEWGGEIRCAGEHPSGRPWTIYISRLGDIDPQKAIATVALKEAAMATSGDYLQNWLWKEEGSSPSTLFFHIFNPKTLRPLEVSVHSVASASVRAPTCALADGLATAAMFFASVKEAQLWSATIQEKYPEITFWLISRQ